MTVRLEKSVLAQWANEDIDLDCYTDQTTWSPTISELVSNGTVSLGPYDLKLDYDYWSYGMVLAMRLRSIRTARNAKLVFS